MKRVLSMQHRFRRDLFWLCERYRNKTETVVGQAAARVLAAERHDAPWRADLQIVLDKVWAVSDFGFYTSSLRAQGAALRIQQRLKEIA